MTPVAIAENSNLAMAAGDRESRLDKIPAVIRAELNADSDRDVLTRMRHLALKKRMRQPDITDEEMADYLALAENYENFEQWLKDRRGTLAPHPSRGAVAWALGTLAIIGLLTASLIVAIAISVGV